MSADQKEKMLDACKNGKVKEIQQLLKEAPSLLEASLDSFGTTPLHEASHKGNIEIVQVLLAHNVDPNTKDKYGSTPLHNASRDGGIEVVRVLACNADINTKNEAGYTPLHWAAIHGHVETAKVLLAFNADPNPKDNYGTTPLHKASNNGHMEVVKLLLACNADPNIKNNTGKTPLHKASYFGHIEVVKALLSSNANPNTKTEDENKPGDSFSSHVNIATQQEIQQLLNEERKKRNEAQPWQSTSSPSSSTWGSLFASVFGSRSSQVPTSSSSTSGHQSSPSSASSSSPQVSETQETERIGTIKCKFGEDAARFSVTKTTTLEELIAIVEEEWGEGKGLKFEDKDGDWLKMRNNDDVVEVWNQTKMGVVTLKVFSQQNQSSSSVPLATTDSSPSNPSGEIAQKNSKKQASEIGWETSNITPPSRCFKRSPQLSFREAIRALLLGLPEVPPGRVDLFIADEDDFGALISRCERALSQMEQFGSAEVKQMVELLERDEALAILAYTCESPYPVYRWLNAWLVQDRRDPLVQSKVGPFFRLLYQGLEKLPQKVVKAGRGVLVYDIPVLRNCFNSPPLVGSEISFWGVSSFSVEDSVASGFGGAAGEDAIFYTCGRLHCVSLGGFSLNPREAEVLPLPPAVFKVNSTFQVNAKKLVISLDHEQATHSAVSYVPPK